MKKVRLNLAVSEEVRKRLEGLKEMSSAESLTEVIRKSLALYANVLEVERNGGKVLFEDAAGRSYLVKII